MPNNIICIKIKVNIVKFMLLKLPTNLSVTKGIAYDSWHQEHIIIALHVYSHESVRGPQPHNQILQPSRIKNNSPTNDFKKLTKST